MNYFDMTNRIILFARKYLNSSDKNICNWGETLQLLTVQAQTKVAVAWTASAIGVTKSETLKLLIQVLIAQIIIYYHFISILLKD